MHPYPYQNQAVRDLAWAIGSPPLMQPGGASCRWYDADWYQELYRGSSDWLQQLDTDHAALSVLIEAERDRRLGRYFELLWQFWFDHSPRHEVLCRNLQVEHGGRTIGELDLVVRDLETGRNIHVEMAVKFYLGLGDTCTASNWYGPCKRDRLDIKMGALLGRQSSLASTGPAREALASRGIRVDDCAVILKGRLYYPGLERDAWRSPQGCAAGHERSAWIHSSELPEIDDIGWTPQSRRGWLAGTGAGPAARSKRAIARAVGAGELPLPLYITGHRKVGGNAGLFVVADGWSTTL